MFRIRTGTLAAGGVFLLACVWFRRFSIDDAFISYRSARHWAQGLGPVMNAGERVEGVSNLPWTALLAVAARLGLEPHRVGPVLGVVCGLSTLLLTAHLASRRSERSHAALAALFLAACAPIAIWSVSGLETLAYTALVTGFALAATRTSWQQRPALLGMMLAGVAVMRPEGVLLAMVWGIVLLRKGTPRRRALQATMGFVLVAGLFLVARLLYYGEWLANPVVAKASPGWSTLLPGTLYVLESAALCLPLIVLAGQGLLWQTRHIGWDRFGTLALGWIGAQTLFVLVVGGERFPGYRFLVPILPFLCVLAATSKAAHAGRRQVAFACSLAALGGVILLFPSLVLGAFESVAEGLRLQRAAVSHSGRLLAEARFLGMACIAAAAIAALRLRSWRLAAAATLVWLTSAWWTDPSLRVCRLPGPAAEAGRVVGEWLAQVAPPDVVVATNAAGALPYFSRLPVIDMLGLTDAHIARSQPDRTQWIGHERGDGKYVLQRHPDIIVFGGPEGSDRPWGFPGDQQIASDPAFARNYELQRVQLPEFIFTYWRARDGRMPAMPAADGAGGDL